MYFFDLPTGRASIINRLMLLWDPEDSGSETHAMGLTVTTMFGQGACAFWYESLTATSHPNVR